MTRLLGAEREFGEGHPAISTWASSSGLKAAKVGRVLAPADNPIAGCPPRRRCPASARPRWPAPRRSSASSSTSTPRGATAQRRHRAPPELGPPRAGRRTAKRHCCGVSRWSSPLRAGAGSQLAACRPRSRRPTRSWSSVNRSARRDDSRSIRTRVRYTGGVSVTVQGSLFDHSERRDLGSGAWIESRSGGSRIRTVSSSSCSIWSPGAPNAGGCTTAPSTCRAWSASTT